MPGFSDFVFLGGYFKTPEMRKYYFYSMSLFEHIFSISWYCACPYTPVAFVISEFDGAEPRFKIVLCVTCSS